MMDTITFKPKGGETDSSEPFYLELSALKREQALSRALFEEQLRLMRHQYDESLEVLRKESQAWRTSSEDEFCRLITTCTRQLTALQEKFDRAIRHEAFVSRKLEEVRQEKAELEEKLQVLSNTSD